jgi:hypothetical protein
MKMNCDACENWKINTECFYWSTTKCTKYIESKKGKCSDKIKCNKFEPDHIFDNNWHGCYLCKRGGNEKKK